MVSLKLYSLEGSGEKKNKQFIDAGKLLITGTFINGSHDNVSFLISKKFNGLR